MRVIWRAHFEPNSVSFHVWRFIHESLGARRADSADPTCPECGSSHVRRIRSDSIDRHSQSAWDKLQRFLGGKLYHCGRCRVQFFDSRRSRRSHGARKLHAAR